MQLVSPNCAIEEENGPVWVDFRLIHDLATELLRQ